MQSRNTPQTTKIVKRFRTPDGKLINQYLIQKRIGEGPYAKIKLARDTKNDMLVAIKKYSLYLLKKKTKQIRTPEGQIRHVSIVQDIWREVDIAKDLNHKNVCRILEILDDQENGKLYLVMEYCQKSDIATWNHKQRQFVVSPEVLEEKRFKAILQGIIDGLSYLHNVGVTHRDIKPQNILLTDDFTPKFIDFGRAAKIKNNERLKGSEGTYHFMAPQMLRQYDKEGYDSKKCDIWSLGVTIYCTLTKQLPFDGDPILKLFEAIEKAVYEYPKDCKIPEKLRKIIDSCLKFSPKDRLSLEELRQLI